MDNYKIMYGKGKIMKNTTKSFVYICWFGALAINIRLLIRSFSNNEPVFSNIVGVALLVIAIISLHFSEKAKEQKNGSNK